MSLLISSQEPVWMESATLMARKAAMFTFGKKEVAEFDFMFGRR